MEDKISIVEIFEQNSDIILKATTEYTQGMNEFGELKEEFEKQLDLKDSQKEMLDEICDKALSTETLLHKQAFIKGFKMARDLLLL